MDKTDKGIDRKYKEIEREDGPKDLAHSNFAFLKIF